MQHDDTREAYELAPEEPGPQPERPHTRQLYQAQIKRPPTCPKCGYDMRGTHSTICPECGLRLNSPAAQRARQSVFRDVYKEPLTYLAVGLAISLGVAALQGGAGNIVATVVGFGATIVIGWIVFIFLSVLWIGFDQPLGTTIVQLAGAYAGAFAASSILSLIGIPLIGVVIPLLVLVGLMSQLLDIDLQDAFATAILSWIAIIVFMIFVVSAI
jgi:hypothetical protein